MSQWFRFYAEVLNDPKVQKLDGETFKDWVNLLCVASQNGGKLPGMDDLAFVMRRSTHACSTLVSRLLDAGLLDARQGGAHGVHYAPHGWEKRQFKSDTSTERVKRFRAVPRNVSETPPEAEAETETEREITGISKEPVAGLQNDRLDTRKAIAEIYTSAGHLPPDTSRAGSWLASGFTADEIVSVVAGVLQRGTVPSSLKYFDRPLADLRTAPRAPPRPSRPRTANDYLSAELRKINDAKSGLNDFAGITIDATAG